MFHLAFFFLMEGVAASFVAHVFPWGQINIKIPFRVLLVRPLGFTFICFLPLLLSLPAGYLL